MERNFVLCRQVVEKPVPCNCSVTKYGRLLAKGFSMDRFHHHCLFLQQADGPPVIGGGQASSCTDTRPSGNLWICKHVNVVPDE